MDTNKYKIVANEIKKKLGNWDYKKQILHANTSETASRVSLVDPLLSILGYKIENDDLRHEYTVEVNSKKLRVDTVIVDGKAKSPLILIECKKASVSLNDSHLRQLLEYLSLLPDSKIGILTNGLEYQFYLKGHSTPFLTFNLESIDQLTLERLAAFHRNNFNYNEFSTIAEEFYFIEEFENALLEELKLKNPELLKLIYKRMGGKRFDEKVQAKISELFNSFSLQSAIDKLRESESSNRKLGIITTQEELMAYSVVRTILVASGKIKKEQLERITYRDFKGHFAIIVDESQNKSICTFTLDKKSLVRIDKSTFELQDPIEVSLSKFKKEIIDSAIKYLT